MCIIDTCIDFATVYTIFRLDYRTVTALWYFFVFNFTTTQYVAKSIATC
jgi:hypothetical protein